METLIFYRDDSLRSQEVLDRLQRLLDRHPQYKLEIFHFGTDFHTAEEPLPYLRTETGFYSGFTLDEFIDRHE